MLDDVLAPHLRLVICGTAVGTTSAGRREYYADPRNKFWRTLHEVGLTTRRLAPWEFRDLLTFGVGLTDLAKGQAGIDAGIDFARASPNDVRAKVLRFEPAILAFNGKKAAGVFLGAPRLRYGPQSASVGATRLFVAPSTSGAASGHWNVESWRELARLVGGARAERV